MTLSTISLSIKGLFVTLCISDSQNTWNSALQCSAFMLSVASYFSLCRMSLSWVSHAECRGGKIRLQLRGIYMGIFCQNRRWQHVTTCDNLLHVTICDNMWQHVTTCEHFCCTCHGYLGWYDTSKIISILYPDDQDILGMDCFDAKCLCRW
jgi:hypothetical protein